MAADIIDLESKRLEAGSSGGDGGDPPTPNQGASAPAEGSGDKKPEDKPAKGKNRAIDWGRYTYLLENFALIYGTDTVWDKSKRRVIKIGNMAHAWGSDYVRLWKCAENRWTVLPEQIIFDPTMKCGPENINLYDGFALEPLPCGLEDVEPILDLLRHLCSETEGTGQTVSVDDVMHWVLSWLALPLQKPGAKLATALIFHGPQGTGKNMFFNVVGKIYGKYARMIGQSELEEKYNEWLSAKLLILANEVVTRQELYHNKNKIKWMITEEQVPIRSMYQDIRWESNHANLVFNSNESQPMALEVDDRRYLVIYTPMSGDPDLYARVLAFMEAGGAEMFMHYLLSYDIKTFHAHTKPPMTAAKAELIELSMRPAERFMHEWLSGYLQLPMRVCSVEQLYRAFRRWSDQSGERYPPAQALFTSTASRFAKERVERDSEGKRLAPPIEKKVVTLKDPTGARKSVRCWIPRSCEPPNGVTEGEWAYAAIDAYEDSVAKFCRTAQREEQE